VHRYICGKIFVKIHSVVLQFQWFDVKLLTNKQTDKRRALHNFLGVMNIDDSDDDKMVIREVRRVK